MQDKRRQEQARRCQEKVMFLSAVVAADCKKERCQLECTLGRQLVEQEWGLAAAMAQAEWERGQRWIGCQAGRAWAEHQVEEAAVAGMQKGPAEGCTATRDWQLVAGFARCEQAAVLEEQVGSTDSVGVAQLRL